MNYTSLSRPSSGDVEFDAFAMPAYHESISSTPIPPNAPIGAKLRFARTQQASNHLTSKRAETPEESPVEISREELEAKLGRNKAEVDVIAAEMRKEMAEFRAFQAQQFSALNTSLSEIKSQISSVNGEVAGLKGQIDGLKTTSATLQWMVGAILALLAVILALPQMQSYLKPADSIPSSTKQLEAQVPAPPTNK